MVAVEELGVGTCNTQLLNALQPFFEFPAHLLQGSHGLCKRGRRRKGLVVCSCIAPKHLAALSHLPGASLLEGKQRMHNIVALDIAAVARAIQVAFHQLRQVRFRIFRVCGSCKRCV